jgi:hypothetical protein
MKNLFIISLLILLVSCANRKVINQITFDKKANSDILIGYSNTEGLKKMPFKEWFNAEYDSYQPDIETINQIDKDYLNKNFRINLVMGTWCSDSRREVPRFVKILESLAFPMDSLFIINVNTEKQAKGTIVNQMNISRIPLFVFYKQGVEVGRIIESPQQSLEKDLLKMISK